MIPYRDPAPAIDKEVLARMCQLMDANAPRRRRRKQVPATVTDLTEYRNKKEKT